MSRLSYTVHERECEAAGIDPAHVRRLTSRLARLAREADQIGLTIFGGSGTGTLRLKDDDICPAPDSNATHAGRLVLADISAGSWDGGDGGFVDDENGLNRGE